MCASVVLVAGHEQTHTCDLPHDELALLSRYFGAIGSSPMARAALKQRGALLIWFDPETIWLAGPSGKRGRPATVSDAAIQACLTLKALFGLPLRQTTGLVASLLALAASLLALAGRDWAVPDFSTLSRGPSGLSIAKLPGERVMARDFDRQVAELQIRAFAGSLGPVAFTRSLHEPLHGPRSAANSTRGMTPFNKRENSTSD